MVSEKIVIRISSGLHLRPVGVLCNRAIEFKSTITMKSGEISVNAKSVLGVLSAGVKYGDEIEIICDGEDEKEALHTLSMIIRNGLGDEIVK
ncbi:MAG: Phosphotransferase System HPr (HPr) Family [Herbinix sp.]|jgi:phosphocarrier protein|nr:Phosphotransferase System HPr (HPr) Family [Herbinix sp.]